MLRKLTLYILLLVATAVQARGADLEKMRQECAATIDKFDYATLTRQASAYLKAADAGGNSRDRAYAHFYLGAACLFTNRGDEAASHLDVARRLGIELGNDSVVALALNSIGVHEATANNNLYLAQWYFTESLKHAKKSHFVKIEGSIYGNLCTTSQMQRDTTMMRYARECYDFGIREHNPHVEFIGAHHLSNMYKLKEQLDSAETYCRRAIDICRSHDFRDVAIAYVTLSSILFDKGQLDESDRLADEAIRLGNEGSNQMVLATAYDQKGRIAQRRGRYEESNEWLQRELDCGGSLELVKSRIYELMAHNYLALGNKDEALRCMTRAKELADSTNSSDREHMKRERDMSFSIIEQERQLEFSQQQLRSRSIIIGILSVAVLLLAYILFISIRNLRRRNQLYKNIVRQNVDAIEREREQDTRLQEQRERISRLEQQLERRSANSVAAETPVAKADKSQGDKGQMIYNELCRLMAEERIYTDPQLNREGLAHRLGTNKTYLTNIVFEHSDGKNLSQFVNQYRIQEAVRVLSDRTQQDYPLKQLCTDLGFGSLSTFYKLFQEGVGMSPSAYRKSFASIME